MAKKAKKAPAKKKSGSKVKKVAARKAGPAKVSPIPLDAPQLTPYFSVSDAKSAITFYKQVFGARERGEPMMGPDGKVGHASLRIGNAVLNLSDMQSGPNAPNVGRSSGVMLYVKDINAVFQKAISLGAKQLVPVMDMFWGDRWGMFEDPYGQLWQIATHIEDVKPAELQKRAMAMANQPPPPNPDPGTPPPPPPDVTTSHHTAQA
ncbi:MAG: VOC family protein [Myxococcaceae bacterium]|nr:VOC family protein [Myxococcaceae bacterium]